MQPAVPSTSRFVILSDSETDAILKSASDCAEGECSIDEVSTLVNDLKNQQKEMERRLSKITEMISQLEHVNKKDDRKSDEVRQFVKDMLRVFSHDVSTTLPSFEYMTGMNAHSFINCLVSFSQTTAPTPDWILRRYRRRSHYCLRCAPTQEVEG